MNTSLATRVRIAMSDPARMLRGGAATIVSPTPAQPAKLNKKRRLKAKVRARMEQTGESYQAALLALRRETPKHGLTDAEVVAEYGEHLGVRVELKR